ncbi:bile acid:sodium symporter family protein [Halobaculum sp. D14]|uniref:bile acid:sodium symporter family protein n=1 Tax=Halobaculum sp. D14 TaxID=3421642 RepID=UPI003EBD7387
MLRRLLSLVDDYLVLWVALAVAVGVTTPRLAAVTAYSTPILAAMVGSVSLTLSVADFREVPTRSLRPALVGHAAMPLVAFAVARLLGLSPALTAGFVVLGGVTPELVTPVMTELADGDTALASAVLVLAGVGSVALLPIAAALFVGGVAVDSARIVEELLVAVVAPMLLAVAVRTRFPAAVGRYDDDYPAVAALLVVVVIGGVAAANADLLRSAALPVVAAGALTLNVAGYGIGWTLGRDLPAPRRVATTLSVGMRDFAVAAALVVAAGFPAAAALPAVAFGVVELATSAALARYWSD